MIEAHSHVQSFAARAPGDGRYILRRSGRGLFNELEKSSLQIPQKEKIVESVYKGSGRCGIANKLSV